MNILVAPLDWGLGHTTRCVPVIACLRAKGHRILFAGNHQQCNYISGTFPGIETIYLEGYNVRYAASGSMFMPMVINQVPSLLRTIRKENDCLKETVKQYNIDLVISDNRYGLYHDTVPSVIITHQLNIITGLGNMADDLLRRLHYRFLNRFRAVWVADAQQAPGLAGRLSHPKQLPSNTQYIGLLSQVEHAATTHTGYLLVLLSGPEPQRTILADKLWQQVLSYTGKVMFVEGSDEAAVKEDIPEHITYHKKLSGHSLAAAISGADMVICRSGYSTLMDLVKLNKKAILIPTPGQTEQEYLGRMLYQDGVFINKLQQSFNLDEALIEAEQFPFKKMQFDNAFEQFKSVINDWLNNIQL
ncbi:MAG: glycosyl transferase family 28 [Taibaiella sp.]|nr:glycosyl transferase family 28 [Taibaiella sp.]